MSDDLSYMGAAEALARFRDGSLSPVELTAGVIARAEAVEPGVGAFTQTYFDEALEAAAAAEARYRSGDARPLEGTGASRAPRFSEDGRWISFFRSGGLHKVRTTGGAVSPLHKVPAFIGGYHWTRDGTFYGAQGQIWHIREGEDAAKQLTNVDANDGRGFDPEAAQGHRFGLVGLHERARLLGGRLRIESTPGTGTRLQATIPL